MAGEWSYKTVAQVCSFLGRGAAPSYVNDGGIAVLNQKCIRDHTVNFALSRRTNDSKKPVKADRVLQAYDVVVNSTGVGTLGRVAQMGEPPETATVDSHVTIARPDSSIIQPYFFGLAMRANEREIESLAEGSTGQTELSRSRLGEVEIPLPPFDEQRAIAHVLGTLDDKIELNRRMNETLEGMARALFKSWFVDFDPVRAKIDGRWKPGQSLSGLPAHLYDLFPNTLTPSELGEMPKGWETGTLADLSQLNPQSWSKKTLPETIQYVDLANTKWGRIEETTDYVGSEAPSRARRVLQPGDTIVGTVRPGNGSYALIARNGLTGSTGFAVLRPRVPADSEFVYLAATDSDNIDALSHLADGGAYPAVRPDVVTATPIVVPTDDALKSFSEVARPMLAKVHANDAESRTLAALRDTLLPKLISGELRIKDAEKFVEDVA